MNVTRIPRFVSTAAAVSVALAMPVARAQQPAPAPATPAQAPAPRVARIVAEPANVTLVAGQPIRVSITAYDSAGAVIQNAPLRTSGPPLFPKLSKPVVCRKSMARPLVLDDPCTRPLTIAGMLVACSVKPMLRISVIRG